MLHSSTIYRGYIIRVYIKDGYYVWIAHNPATMRCLSSPIQYRLNMDAIRAAMAYIDK